MEALGPKIRRQRRRLGLTLDELAVKAGISKPYLSLIETGRVPNPPSDEKLRKLELVLGFPPNDLLTQAHLHRTPRDVRAILHKLLTTSPTTQSLNLDELYASGVLKNLVEQTAPNVERVSTRTIPIINRVSAGYPSDFTDMDYPPKVADAYISCPDLEDPNAFGARVHGDSMTPKYAPDDVVVFSPAAQPKDGDDCFIRFADGQTTFKRVFFETNPDGQPTIRLQPRNERYRPQTVPSQEVAGLYKAIFRYQRVDSD